MNIIKIVCINEEEIFGLYNQEIIKLGRIYEIDSEDEEKNSYFVRYENSYGWFRKDRFLKLEEYKKRLIKQRYEQ